ncbi:hypothetical protein GCM10023238_02680 [Streptomyces heliomycini]
MTVVVEVPEELSARVPVEQRGPGLDRDSVRLLSVAGHRRCRTHAFVELPRLLAGRGSAGGEHVADAGGGRRGVDRAHARGGALLHPR